MTRVYLTVEDVQEMLHITRDVAYGLFRLEEFPCIQIGRKYIVDEQKLYDYLDKKEGKRIYLR